MKCSKSFEMKLLYTRVSGTDCVPKPRFKEYLANELQKRVRYWMGAAGDFAPEIRNSILRVMNSQRA